MKKSLLRTVLVFVTSLVAAPSLAYIPDYKMIMSRVAENHGRGIYSVEQDVIFPHEPNPLIVREKWLIKDGDAMRVTIEGRGSLKDSLSGTFVYEGNKRFYKDPSGSTKVARVSQDWFEHFFHFRWSKRIKADLVGLKIAPADSLKERAFKDTKEGVQFTTQPWVRLARAGGTINYGIGTPTPVGASKPNPGLWIEQDQFVVRKLRLPTLVEVEAEQYSRYPYGLWLPKVRSVRWDNNNAKIQLIKVKRLSSNSKTLARLSAKSLNTDKNTAKSQLPENQTIREFYTRFR